MNDNEKKIKIFIEDYIRIYNLLENDEPVLEEEKEMMQSYESIFAEEFLKINGYILAFDESKKALIYKKKH